LTDYCTSDDVKANLKGVEITASSAVTIDGLADIIEQESALIDTFLVKYELPISGASALLVLKKICIALCVYRVSYILQPKTIRPTADGNVEQDISHYAGYKNAMKMLAMLASGEINLPAEDKKSISYFSSTAVNNDEVCEFIHNEKQW
jgi:phage gp36-like protein